MRKFLRKLMSLDSSKGLKVSLMILMLLSVATAANAQNKVITGTVVDQAGMPVIGASVVETGTMNGVSTDVDGKFSLTFRENGETITVEYLGYISQEINVSTRSDVQVTLEEDAIGIEAVVAIGYGTVKQKDLTTSVSIVDTDDLDRRPITSVSGVLQGKAAGVQVIQANGAPGSGMVIRVRGASSIASSNDPLYVVDGVPVGEGESAIAYLSPNDIESMQVLKDASSAAIYGSRAANGVVLITTKQGSKKDGAMITFSSFVGISNVAKTFDVLNTEQYIELQNEIGLIKGLPTTLTDQTDWFEETYSTGVNQNYQFSVSDGDEKGSYYVGGGYTNEQGVINTTSAERFNVKVNFDRKIRKWLTATAQVTYSNYNNKGGIITGQGGNRAGVVVSTITTPTYAPIWNAEKPNQYYNNFYGATMTSPLENMARTDYDKSTTNRLLATGGLTFNLYEGLVFKSTVTMDSRWVHSSSFLDPIRTTYGRKQMGSASDTRSEDRRMIYDNILTYNYTSGRHKLEVMGGTSATTSVWEQLSGSRSYFSADNNNAIPNLNGGNKGGLRGQNYGKSEWAIMSYLARASYNFGDKYLFTANFRADGSSKLAPDHRWGYFPSFSAAWRISGENFMKDVTWIDDLKLRVGWGQTGNQAGLSEYGYLQQYNTNYTDWTETGHSQDVPTLGDKSNIKNADLTWETTTQTNVGIDWSLFNHRLEFTVDAYYKYTKDMLMWVPLPDPYPSIMRNEGEMSNWGLEFAISSQNIAHRDFSWSTDFNISLNRNKLESLDLQQVYYYSKTADMTNDYVVRMTPGHALSKFWGYISDGVNPETGDLMYRDINEDGQITPSDKTWIGNANPKFTFGMTNNFSWKGLNLNVLITGSYGNDIFNASRIETEGMYNGYNQTTDVLRRWRIPGQITDMPRASQSNYNVRNSTRWIEDGSYIKIKNITLSYDIPCKRWAHINISKIQPYVTLSNFFTFTNYSGYDPEVSQSTSATSMGIDWGTYPNVRTVVLGLNVNF
ncbi:MAG: TonB-dependent receptor [Alistipes sp.]|nr:TonB-dependent receptor [Alistipes sp.]